MKGRNDTPRVAALRTRWPLTSPSTPAGRSCRRRCRTPPATWAARSRDLPCQVRGTPWHATTCYCSWCFDEWVSTGVYVSGTYEVNAAMRHATRFNNTRAIAPTMPVGVISAKTRASWPFSTAKCREPSVIINFCYANRPGRFASETLFLCKSTWLICMENFFMQNGSWSICLKKHFIWLLSNYCRDYASDMCYTLEQAKHRVCCCGSPTL